jgi:hypothetical protein
MLRFIIGLVIGIVIGALAVLAFTALGTFGDPLSANPLPAPGQAVVHISVDKVYLNQELRAVLATQAQFANANPQLDLRSPNAAVLTADIQTEVGGRALKVRPTVTMQFQVENGRIRTKVMGVTMGTLNLPNTLIKAPVAQLESTLEDQVNRAVSGALSGTGLKVYNVTTSSNALVVDLGQ